MFDAFLQSYQAFRQAGVDDPLHETLRLFDLLSNGALRRTHLDGIKLEEVIARRQEGVPLEYILGRASFMGLALECAPGALIPRAETELLVNTALNFIREKQVEQPDLTIIDMGTGSGNVAVSLAFHSQNTRILASDVSAEAIALARRQVARFNVQERVTLFCGDLFAPLRAAGYEETVDMVVCNPPYLPTSSLEKLPPEIIEHEPVVALDAGSYGLDIYRGLIAGAATMLKPDGILLFEIGAGQEKLANRLLRRNGRFTHIQEYQNDAGQTRVLSAVRQTDE